MTDHEKYECAKRELAMRRRVYPKWVDSGRMSQDKANHEIAAMTAILEDYKVKINPSLFAQQEST